MEDNSLNKTWFIIDDKNTWSNANSSCIDNNASLPEKSDLESIIDINNSPIKVDNSFISLGVLIGENYWSNSSAGNEKYYFLDAYGGRIDTESSGANFRFLCTLNGTSNSSSGSEV